ncbi:MAG: prolyl oligopeptidase family serine peptidase [Clostridia bacterium]|nr:prolyl oligopeptidase family serine peptidase [Clostridia bacterium]
MTLKSGRFIYKGYPDMELAFYLEQPRVKKFEFSPVVMNNVGGGWAHYEVLDAPYYAFAGQDKLLDEGYAILTVGHRGGDYGAQMNELLSDLIDALAYIYSRNDQFELDLDRIVPMGHSAGGHVSLMVAMAPAELMTECCVNLCEGFHYRAMGCIACVPPILLYPDPESGKMLFPVIYTENRTIKYLFGGAEYTEECYKTYSPMTYARAELPPILLIPGEKDNIVDVKQSILLHEKLTSLGTDCRLVVVKNGEHSYLPVDGEISPTREEIDRLMYDFFVEMLEKNA